MDNYMDVKLEDTGISKTSAARYKSRMIEENNIPYMLRPASYELDGSMWLRYKTSGNYILERVLLGLRLDGGLLKLIMAQIFACIFSLEEYLLSANDLVIDIRYMTYNTDTNSIGMIYVPEYNTDIRQQLRVMLEVLMKEFDHRDSEGLVYMYGIYDMLTDQGISMVKLREAVLCEAEANINDPYVEPPKHECEISCLVPLTNGLLEPISFCDYKEKIVIGRGKKQADYRIATNQISRVHACVFIGENGIWVQDENSTNGTFVNSVRLTALESRQLRQGDIVAFANEEFFVK
ncbi:MAG: FHA domain-containing protein [Clostridium sp.]|nr:FHA domain-containing protein [Clostridium sp.]MCM1171986.1 FHA domain-containing protein [Clostridium sp.]MCM1208690.1 FHA domain-containing protein [Ruminococcus sp.]